MDGDLNFQGGPKKEAHEVEAPSTASGEGRRRCTDEYLSLRTGEQLPVKAEELLSVVLEVAFHSVGRPSS
jgi:hypothetical protein